MPLALTVRNGIPESLHTGAAVAIDAGGRIVFAAGDPQVVVFGRSANKPMQAAAMVAAGLDVAPRALAIGCSSHDGSAVHLAAVRDLLAGAGLDETALGNTPDWPLDPAERDAALLAGGHCSALQMNCSGKHAAMLATCVANGWPGDHYLDPGHPLQQRITSTIADLSGARVAGIGVDGCGAPAHALPLVGLARAFAAIASASAGPGLAVAGAMRAHPALIGGEQRSDTALMRAVPGLIAKEGAEGVFAAALPDGRAVAVKIADGAARPRAAVALAALGAIGIHAELPGVPAIVFGHGRPVGRVEVLVS